MPQNDISAKYTLSVLELIEESLKLVHKKHLSTATIWDIYSLLVTRQEIRNIFTGDTTKLSSIIPVTASTDKSSKVPNSIVRIDENVEKLLLIAFQLSKRYGKEFVGLEDLFLSYWELPESEVRVRKLGVTKSTLERKIISLFGGEIQPPTYMRTPVLDKYSTDFSSLSYRGNLSEIVGRLNEIGQVVRILSRESRINVILLGEPGVGKQSIVQGFANMIRDGKVPSKFINSRIVSLSLTSLFGAAVNRNSIEDIMSQILEELKKATEVILFIEDIHLIADSSSQSQEVNFISNLLKPAIAKGEIQVIGSTTIADYRKSIETDPILAKRFEIVKVDEPSIEESIKIARLQAVKFQNFHKVEIKDDAVRAAVELSKRYLTDKFLPDKAIELLDESATNISNGIVTADDIRRVLSEKTGIPLEKLGETESQKLASLEDILRQSVKGQEEAIYKVSEVIRRSRAGLKDPKKPIGSFLFLGQSGVGKTELAKTITKVIYDTEKAMIRIDMSEFSEQHTVQRLVGAPPGYVGYEEGGQLTNPVWERPYSLVLLDEIEKAHPKVLDIFLQVLDDGRLTDGKGRTVDFKNTIIIATSNLGADLITDFQMNNGKVSDPSKYLTNLDNSSPLASITQRDVFRMSLGMTLGFENIVPIATRKDDSETQSLVQTTPNNANEDNSKTLTQKLYDLVLPILKQHFRTEFINRFDDVVIFNPLSKEALTHIAELNIKKVEEKLKDRALKVTVKPETVRDIVERSYSPQFGARPLLRVIQERIENVIARQIIEGKVKDGQLVEF